MPQRTLTLNQKRGQKKLFSLPRYSDPFYSSGRWRKLRNVFMARPENAVCRICKESGAVVPASVVDHIRPRQVEPSLELDTSNLQALCIACHNRKTSNDIRAGNAGRKTRDEKRPGPSEVVSLKRLMNK